MFKRLVTRPGTTAMPLASLGAVTPAPGESASAVLYAVGGGVPGHHERHTGPCSGDHVSMTPVTTDMSVIPVSQSYFRAASRFIAWHGSAGLTAHTELG